MQRVVLSVFVAAVFGACGGSDETVTDGGSSTGAPASSSDGDTPVSVSDPSAASVDTTDATTCGDACPTGSGSTSSGSTTAADSTTSTSSAEASSSEDSSVEESTTDTGNENCGNGAIDGDEECDEAGESATCDDDCTFVDCGDENVNQAAGETCDAGGQSVDCDNDCTAPVCGDGLINASADETCDDGGETVNCDNNCTAVACGDGTQNITALESCDDGNNTSDDGCSGTCVLEGEFGGTCRIVDGTQWCFDQDNCGQACEEVCSTLGLVLEPDDMTWFAAQDSLAECQAIADAFEMTEPPNFGDHPLGCLEDEGNDLVGGGLTGSLLCSADPNCPAAHRTEMDGAGTNCNLVGARRSVCPCAGEFCGNGVVEGVEECDDGNLVNNDGCTTGCSTTPPTCQVIAGQQWCFNDDACGQACNDVCDSLGLTIAISDNEWFQLQDSAEECEAIADAFGMAGIDFSGYTYACLEDSGNNDVVGGGLTGSLFCSSTPMCPMDHRTNMDQLGIACGMAGARRSICPCD